MPAAYPGRRESWRRIRRRASSRLDGRERRPMPPRGVSRGPRAERDDASYVEGRLAKTKSVSTFGRRRASPSEAVNRLERSEGTLNAWAGMSTDRISGMSRRAGVDRRPPRRASFCATCGVMSTSRTARRKRPCHRVCRPRPSGAAAAHDASADSALSLPPRVRRTCP